MLALLAWRTLAGAVSQKEAGSTTMLMGLPEWIAFVAMAPPMILTALIALYMMGSKTADSHGPSHKDRS